MEPGRMRWRTVGVVAVSALSLLLVWRVGAYLMGRSALEKELLAAIRAEWAALEEEERSIPEGANAAAVWEEAARVLPPALWCRVQAEEKGNVEGVLAKAAPGLALVDRALAMEECLFPVKKEMSPLGPFRRSPLGHFRVIPLGPVIQKDLACSCCIPRLLVLRARKALAEDRVADAREDARRILRCVEQATERWYEGPISWCGAIRQAATLMEEILGRPDLTAGEARLLAGFPGSAELQRGRDNQLRLHRLHADIDLLALVSGEMRPEETTRFREEMGLPPALPLLGFALSDLDGIRALRASPRRPFRHGLQSWPAAGPPSTLARLDLLRAAAALRAFQIEKGRPASRLEDLVPDHLPAVPLDPWTGGPLAYEVQGDRWLLRVPAGRHHVGLQTDGTWLETAADLSFRWPPRPVPDSAWQAEGF